MALLDSPTAAQRLREWLDGHRRVFVLTGAGVSTDSGNSALPR